MTSKQRAYLRGMANDYPTILQIGKDGISENLIKQVDGALETRELIKINCLETAGITTKDAARVVAEATNADVVQVIGWRIVLYRQAQKDPKIVLPIK